MTPDLTAPQHAHETVILAAQWLAEQREPPAPLVPELKQRFGITTSEACQVCALAGKMRMLRSAHA